MTRASYLSLILAVAFFGDVRAGIHNTLMRRLGYGWSDGYHAPRYSPYGCQRPSLHGWSAGFVVPTGWHTAPVGLPRNTMLPPAQSNLLQRPPSGPRKPIAYDTMWPDPVLTIPGGDSAASINANPPTNLIPAATGRKWPGLLPWRSGVNR